MVIHRRDMAGSARPHHVPAGRLGTLDMRALRLVLLFMLMMGLTGCPGPDYAPYDNMTNSPG
jgi:hypothetical protein